MTTSTRFVLLLSAVVAGAIAYGCDDGGGEGGFARAIPTFTNAEPVPESVLSESDAFIGSWRTSGDVAAVRQYYEEQLRDGDWRIVEVSEVPAGVVIRVEDPDDANTSGVIIVRREGESTRIDQTISRADEDDDRPSDRPPEGSLAELPEGYPEDVPLPDDVDIVSGSAPLVEDLQYYLVEFTSDRPPADVIAFFTQALAAQGWQSGASETDPGAFALNFTRGADSVLVTGGESGEGTNASVTIIVQE